MLGSKAGVPGIRHHPFQGVAIQLVQIDDRVVGIGGTAHARQQVVGEESAAKVVRFPGRFVGR
jgi:hypothetical protein